jgi:hypothetical protein
MNGAYPTTADSLAEWLEAINLGKYLPNLEKAGVKPEELPELTEDTLQAAGVGIVGHRRRMVTAAQTLMPPTPKDAATDRHVEGAIVSAAAREGEARPQPSTHVQPGQLLSIKEAIEAKEQMRYNSTSSVYISSTISKPDTEEITFCVAVVIHDRIMQGEVQPAEVRSRFYYFSEDNNPLYAEPVPSSDDALAKKPKREVPSEETIYHTIHSIHDCAGFSSECLIVCLIYMERITSTSAVPILVTTWRPILLAALIIAQKVWDDRSLHNADFSVFCPMFTLKEINHLEKKVRDRGLHSLSASLISISRRRCEIAGYIVSRRVSHRTAGTFVCSSSSSSPTRSRSRPRSTPPTTSSCARCASARSATSR